MSYQRLVALVLLWGALPALAQSRPVWSPDGRHFAFEENRVVNLYDIPARTQRALTPLSKLEAEAKPVPAPLAFEWQTRGVKEQTIQWFPDGERLLIAAGGDLFELHVGAGRWTQLTSTAEAESDPKLSPDGLRISFRRASDLYSMEVASRKVTRLTSDGSGTLYNGRLDWVYPEELDLATAHWISPDSKLLAYLQFDVSREPLFPHADLLPLRAVYEPQRYPQAGEQNATVRLGVVPITGGPTRWMKLGDALLARVEWTPDSHALFVQRLNRVQNRLDLVHADAATGETRLVLHQEDPFWVNLADDLQFLKKGAEFLWTSERDGFRHLYRYSADGRELARLTSGDWEVTSLAGVDEAGGQVYFVSTESGPLERHLYRVSLAGSARLRLTQAAGTHDISMAPGCAHYLETFSSLQSPPRRAIFQADGAEWALLQGASSDQRKLPPFEIVSVKARDGAALFARLIRPAGFEAGRKYPAVVVVYGGPHAQDVRDRWQALDLEQALAERGFVVWQLDNRGTSGRGHRWESAVFRNFGAKELEDQLDGVRHLVSLGLVDESRLGLYGWSYGGFMTLDSLLNSPETFRAGVAGAPVTDWRNYDTIYTERYMGLPSENPEGYRRSALVNQAGSLKAGLLLIHNLEDDNVLFQNTLQMADALQRAGRPFEMMVYPQKTHSVAGAARRQLLELVVSYFERMLRGG